MNELKINNFPLDEMQIKAAMSDAKYLMIIAGAGSGKSTTMVGKIKYLCEYKKINPSDILCISFTNDSCESLKNSILKNSNLNIDVLTFHKLALKILEKKNFIIADDKLLEFIVDELPYAKNKNIQILITHYIKNRFYSLNQKDYENILNSYAFKQFKKDIHRFLMLYRSQYASPNKLYEWKNNTHIYKEKCFFSLTIIIYKIYENEKESQNKVDFDDMIHLAAESINNHESIVPYKYVIIDEFQDTSASRFALVDAIIKNNNANLTVVGDDFQSIYAFNGCSLNEFLKFKYNFDCELISINNVYRNSQELINIAGDFIMKNDNQIKKNLLSTKNLKNPIKLIEGYNLEQLIIEIYQKYGNDILILGRNNNDINLYLSQNMNFINDSIIIKNKTNIQCRYLTIHRSKGLEANNVIIVNNNSGTLGFPTEMPENKILNYVKKKETYPYEEERRLFYVALTRSKNYVFLMYDKRNPSIFIKELKKNYLN